MFGVSEGGFEVMATVQKLPGSSTSTASSYGSCRVDDEQFPAGLRVLVVDDDVTCLRILEHMLQRCRYHGKLVPCPVHK